MNGAPKQISSAVNGETESRPRKYFEALRSVGERYFAAWPVERDVIIANHKREQEDLSKQFGVSVQQLADDLGENPSDEALLHASVSVTYPGKDPNEIPAFDERNDPLLSWLMLEKGRFGGLFGSKIAFGVAPIFSPRETLALDDNREEELRDYPPVTVWWNGSQQSALDTVESVGAHLAAWTWHNRHRPIARDRMPGEVRDRFDDLAAALFEVLGMPISVGVEGSAVRAAYRTFARLFYPWATALPPSEKPSPEDGAKVARKTRASSSFFAGRDIAQTSADPIAFGAHRALSSPYGWVQSLGEIPYFDDTFSGLRFSIGGISGEDTPEDLTVIDNDAWLDPKTSIIHEAIIAKWLHAHRTNSLSKSGAVAIRVDEILDMRGAKKHHKGGFRREDKVDYSRRLQRLESVFVRGQYVDPQGKKHAVKGRLVNVTIDEELDLLGTGTPYAFLVKPGDATWAFFAASVYLTDFYMALARLDVSQGVQLKAYLLGRYFMHQWRVREAHQNFEQPFRVATLIENARIPKESNANHYLRFREQFDQALDHLKQIGVIAGWEYGAGDEEGLPVRGWFAKWVDHCRVVVTPPPSVVEHGRLRAASQSERVKAIVGRKRKDQKHLK